jgi:ParB-like chromosome segregation protein Spo0J
MRIIIKSCGRPEFVNYLKQRLPNAEFCFDQRQDAMDTFIRSLEMAGDEAALHLEDDIILTVNFIKKVEAVINQIGKDVMIQFFSIRPTDLKKGARMDRKFSMNQCTYFPKGYSSSLREFAPAWIENNPKAPTAYDWMMDEWLRSRKEAHYINIPSLVQHRQEISAINKTRSRFRQSKTFIAADGEFNNMAVPIKNMNSKNNSGTKNIKTLTDLKVIEVDMKLVSPNDYNPNRQSEADFDLLIRSIKEDGFTQPIVVIESEHGYTIVDGEHRFRAMRFLGNHTIPVIVAPMTPEQAKIATIRHNRARGTEKDDLVDSILQGLVKDGHLSWTAESLMLNDEEVDELLEGMEEIPEIPDEPEPELPEPSEKPATIKATEEPSAQTEPIVAAKEAKESPSVPEVAPTEEASADIYNISLIYEDAEAILVKNFLGNDPRGKVLELAQAAMPAKASVEE